MVKYTYTLSEEELDVMVDLAMELKTVKTDLLRTWLLLLVRRLWWPCWPRFGAMPGT